MFRKKKETVFVNMKQMLKEAKEGNYAVPHFNINNLEWAKYILEESQELKTPLIIGVSEGAMKYMGGYQVVAKMVEGLMMDLKISIPVALHLDHGSSVASCKAALEAGFSSVMIDASRHELSENISMTKEVVQMAKKYNASVEAEIGHVGNQGEGVANSEFFARTDECMKLINSTNLDALAPALGSVHGLYKGEANLDFVRMLEISQATKMPLVLHGGTGIPDEKISKAIECGMCKINFNTELQIAWRKGLGQFVLANPDVYDPRKVIGAGELGIKEVVKAKVNLLKSINKAL